MQSIVQAAAAEDVRVRCVGSRHSWAPLFSDDRQLLIHVAKMQSDYSDGSRIRLVNVNKYIYYDVPHIRSKATY